MLEVVSGVGCEKRSNSPKKIGVKVRRLARGETLFQAGDHRTRLYRVERGALCHYVRWDDGRHEVIEFAFAGDLIGFGHLDTHTSTAQAAARTIVSEVDPQEFDELLDSDGQLAARYAAAADREFDFMRMRASALNRNEPARRVASLLLALSRMGESEGRQAHVVTDEVSSSAVADQLDLSIDTLRDVLRELGERGLVSESAQGLRIVDMQALEKFSDTGGDVPLAISA
jgi:CRP/FNR family transcriptional regulator